MKTTSSERYYVLSKSILAFSDIPEHDLRKSFKTTKVSAWYQNYIKREILSNF